MKLAYKIITAKLTWPTVYRMFALVYSNRKILTKKAELIQNTYVKQGEFINIEYEDIPVLHRAWLLFSMRTEGLIMFCKKHKLEACVKALLKFHVSKKLGLPQAVRNYYKDKHLTSTVTEPLEVGLGKQLPRHTWKALIMNDSTLINSLDIYRDSGLAKSYTFSNQVDSPWTSYQKIYKEVA